MKHVGVERDPTVNNIGKLKRNHPKVTMFQNDALQICAPSFELSWHMSIRKGNTHKVTIHKPPVVFQKLPVLDLWSRTFKVLPPPSRDKHLKGCNLGARLHKSLKKYKEQFD